MGVIKIKSLYAVSRERAFIRTPSVAQGGCASAEWDFFSPLFCAKYYFFCFVCLLVSFVLFIMAAYTLPEGFTDFDMFTFGTALLVGGKWTEWQRQKGLLSDLKWQAAVK